MKLLFGLIVFIVIGSIFYIDRIEPFDEECVTDKCTISDNNLKSIINENISKFNSLSVEEFTNYNEFNSPKPKKYSVLENIYFGLIGIFLTIMLIPI
jgi:hypothetical protein